DAVLVAEAATTLARAARRDDDELAPLDDRRELRAVARHEAAGLDEPPEDGHLLERLVEDRVRHRAGALEEERLQHAEVHRERAAVVADDERRSRPLDPIEAPALEAVVAAHRLPVTHPRRAHERGAGLHDPLL